MVVVPASLRLVWAEELERWLPHLRPRSIHVIYGSKDWPPPPDKLKVMHSLILLWPQDICSFANFRVPGA